MWLLTNETPFAADRSWTRDERGAEFWLVVTKATFRIDGDGKQVCAATQTPVAHAPVFWGDPMMTGLRSDSDFVLSKAGTDILVEGDAIAPGGGAKRSEVRLKVADVDKTLVVHGERRLYEGAVSVAMTDAEPFARMPLVWERTYGGYDRTGESETWLEANPAGCGFARHPAALYGTQAPNVEYPDAPYEGAGAGRPACFGPVAHHWSPRARHGGTYDTAWEETRDPLVPADFDRRYFHAAPEDQQTKEPLHGYESVAAGGMSDDGVLRFVLPRIVIEVITSFRDRRDIRQRPAIQTLRLLPNARMFEIVWQSSLEVPPGREEALIGSTVRLRPRMNIPASVAASGVWSGV